MTIDELMVEWDAVCEGGVWMYGYRRYDPYGVETYIRLRFTTSGGGWYATNQHYHTPKAWVGERRRATTARFYSALATLVALAAAILMTEAHLRMVFMYRTIFAVDT